MKKFKKSLRTVFLSAAVAISGLGSFGTSAHAQTPTQITYSEERAGDVHLQYQWITYSNGNLVGYPYGSYIVANDNGTLHTNNEMESRKSIMDPNFRSYQLKMQADGNLVLYKYLSPKNFWPIWATNTMGSGAVRATMQPDGNFVLFRADGRAVWASNTQYRNNGANHTFLELQQDGNLVMYNYYYTDHGWTRVAVWATGTNE